MAKSFDDIMTDITGYVNANIGTVDTRVGTVLREAILGPVANELVDVYAQLDQIQQNQTISSPESISSDAMNGIAANFGLTKFGGTASSGYVQFYRFNMPTGSIFIPAGTKVFTSSTGDSMYFSTLNAATLSSSSPQDPVSGAYYVDVAVQCSVTGSVGNVSAGTISIQTIAGIDGVTNQNDFTTGQDTQTNTQLAELIAARAQGNMGTASGYRDLIENNYSVEGMTIITPTDPEANRAQYGGALDIIIQTSTYIQSVETPSLSATPFYPMFLPLLDVVSINGFDSTDAVQTLIPVTDYDVVIDDYSPLSGSYEEKSHINFHIHSFIPKTPSVLTVTYSNTELIRVIQSFLEDQANKILGSDVLVKVARSVGVNISADIVVVPGNDPTTIQDACVTSVTNFLNSKLLGQSVDASDVIAVIADTTGVDAVDLATFKMARADTPSSYVQEVVAIKQNYIVASTITINVVG